MSQSTQSLLEQYIIAVKNIYGEHLKKIILYGSYARGDYTKDSDIDIMVLVDLPDTQLDIYSDPLSEIGFEYNVSHDIWFMPIVKNIEHFQHWSTQYPFYANITKEGISLYEAA